MHFLSEGAYRIGTQLSIILSAFSFSTSSYFHQLTKFPQNNQFLMGVYLNFSGKLSKNLRVCTHLLPYFRMFDNLFCKS